MKKSTLLLIACLALSNCTTSIESKSDQKSSRLRSQEALVSQGDQRADVFIQNQTIIDGELLTLVDRGREVDIVPQLSEVVKFGNQCFLKTLQLDWTYGIGLQVLV